MSDLESGIRSEEICAIPASVEIFWPGDLDVDTSNAVQSFLQLPDSDQAISHMTRESPTHPENVEVDVSKDFFVKTFGRMTSTAPTRGDYYRKARPPTIYKVPWELKKGDEGECYEPVAARIGPFTGNKKSTVQLENYKWCCMRQLISRHHRDSDVANGRLLNLCLNSMKRLEPVIRASYSEDIEDDSDGLALQMLLDGCFILHRLLKYARREEREAPGVDQADEKDDDWTQVFGRVWVWQLVTSDLLLLENQIPFFVLSELFQQLGRTENEPKDALVKGSLGLFRSLCSHMLRRSASATDFDDGRVHHLLHLFYLSMVGPTSRPSEIGEIKHSSHQAGDVLLLECPQWIPCTKELEELLECPQWIPCAKELEEAGVRLKRKKDKDTRFLDIEFNIRSGVLEIPPLQLYDFSDKLFRNLIAFEQTFPGTQRNISTYAVFMDCLINTPEDMRILHLRGILINQINGEQDASRFFSRICAQVYGYVDKSYLKNVMDEVNTYRGTRLHKWRAALVRNYFSNPWVIISVVAAVLMLAMTILQTTFTVYPYFKPPK